LLNAEQRRPVAGFSGGQMFELAGHLIDPMVRLLGKPLRVTSFLQEQGSFRDGMKDNAVAVMEWPHALGVIVSTSLEAGASPRRSFEILGTKGTAVVRPVEPPTLYVESGAGKRTPPMPVYKRYVDDFRDFAAAIREGRGMQVTAAEELAVQETLLRASGMV
jgi:predicted dehydrogenase